MSNDTTLASAVDTVIPADEWPGGWEGGAAALIANEPDFLAASMDVLGAMTAALDAEARRAVVSTFAELPAAGRERVLAAVTSDEGGHAAGGIALVHLALTGYYASTRQGEPAGLRMIGFRGVPQGVRTVEPEPWPTVGPRQLDSHYDIVIVGAGAGGGIAAGVLAEGGAKVLLVERAPIHTNAELRGDHIRGKRPGLGQPTASPGPGHPRMIVQPDGSVREVPSVEHGAWGLNAMTLGGGTRVWQGMSWRFMPEDFAMATTYGVPVGSSLTDWPFGYDELAPYYDRAEWEIGVSGDEGPLTARTPRSRPYPMPALPGSRARQLFAAAADRLGWGWGPIPFAINSVPRFGRAACVACPQCVGHACPVDAKNGTHNTLIRRALAAGTCHLAAGAQVVQIDHTAGRATGVRVVFDGAEHPEVRTVRCEQVVVAAGAVETPRLLLVSGLGNDQVGTNLHTHGGCLVLGVGPEPVDRYVGPGHNLATLDFVHRDCESWGGGVLWEGLPLMPVVLAQMAPLFGVTVGGVEHKRWMREGLPHVFIAMGMGQEIPSTFSRVGIDPQVVDRVGMPVARLQTELHPASRDVMEYMAERCRQWLTEVGCETPHTLIDPNPPPAGEHSAGTCRMGDDPTRSVCDASGLVHGTENVYVADASLHPTNGSVNPGLTVMANAFRVADLLLDPSR